MIDATAWHSLSGRPKLTREYLWPIQLAVCCTAAAHCVPVLLQASLMVRARVAAGLPVCCTGAGRTADGVVTGPRAARPLLTRGPSRARGSLRGERLPIHGGYMAKTYGLWAHLRRNNRIAKAAFGGSLLYALTVAAAAPVLNAAVEPVGAISTEAHLTLKPTLAAETVQVRSPSSPLPAHRTPPFPPSRSRPPHPHHISTECSQCLRRMASHNSHQQREVCSGQTSHCANEPMSQ